MKLDPASDTMLIDPSAVGRAEVLDEDPAVFKSHLRVQTRGGRVSTQYHVAFFSSDGQDRFV